MGDAVADSVIVESGSRLEIGHSMLIVRRRDLTAPGQVTDRLPDPANIVVTPTGQRRRASSPIRRCVDAGSLDPAEATARAKWRPVEACCRRCSLWPAPACRRGRYCTSRCS